MASTPIDIPSPRKGSERALSHSAPSQVFSESTIGKLLENDDPLRIGYELLYQFGSDFEETFMSKYSDNLESFANLYEESKCVIEQLKSKHQIRDMMGLSYTSTTLDALVAHVGIETCEDAALMSLRMSALTQACALLQSLETLLAIVEMGMTHYSRRIEEMRDGMAERLETTVVMSRMRIMQLVKEHQEEIDDRNTVRNGIISAILARYKETARQDKKESDEEGCSGGGDEDDKYVFSDVESINNELFLIDLRMAQRLQFYLTSLMNIQVAVLHSLETETANHMAFLFDVIPSLKKTNAGSGTGFLPHAHRTTSQSSFGGGMAYYG